MKSLTRFAIAIFLLLMINISCKKNIDQTIDPGQLPDFTTKVTSSASGFVSNENGQPLPGALVKLGSFSVMTDQFGYFEIKNALVVKEAAVVTVEYAGYFKGIKTYMATEGKSGFFRIRLLPKSIAGTIQSGSGGSITLTNGLTISFPANAIKIAASGALYTGTVSVAAQWIDPTSAELDRIMPGDLRAINAEGYTKLLTTYGMAAVELIGSSGESLQIADGKKASMTFPLPASISANAPATIRLWYFDEQTGFWKEEGMATKVGNTYVGDVSHFSFWNVDIPGNYVQFSATVLNSNNSPFSYGYVKISLQANPSITAWGFTDSNGYVAGAIPANTALKMEVFALNACNTPLFTQNFTTTTVAYPAGTIILPANNPSAAFVSGTITNCSNAPATSGYLMVHMNNQYTRYNLNSNGGYSFSTWLCTASTPATFLGVDLGAGQQSGVINQTIVVGVNAIPDIQACGTTLAMYDGKFLMKGIHNRPLYMFPYSDTMEMWTSGANEVSFYWPAAGSFGHPFSTDANNTLTWYGPAISPAISFDPITHEITDVHNVAIGPTTTPISIYNGPLPTHNYYDPILKKIYVAWQYNNNPDRAFFDTLTYIGPR